MIMPNSSGWVNSFNAVESIETSNPDEMLRLKK